jgi:uncharacterized membrane protein
MALLVLAAAGVVVSSLALARHFAPEVEPADPSSYWNSSAVNHSPYAVVDGIPVAVLGIAGYALTGAMAFYRRRELTAVCSLFGLAYELYLTNLGAHILQLWCVYRVVFLAIITSIVFWPLGATGASPASKAAQRGMPPGSVLSFKPLKRQFLTEELNILADLIQRHSYFMQLSCYSYIRCCTRGGFPA